MIPAKFDYVKPASAGDAVRALDEGGEDAKVIAGGQSLLPLLRLRLAYPELLVDVGGLSDLRGVRDEADSLLIGALTTHDDVLRDPLIARHCGLIAETAGKSPAGSPWASEPPRVPRCRTAGSATKLAAWASMPQCAATSGSWTSW